MAVTHQSFSMATGGSPVKDIALLKYFTFSSFESFMKLFIV